MIKSLIPRNWPFFLILGILLVIWLVVGQVSAYQYTDDNGTIIVKPDTARYAYVVGDTPQIVADRLYSLSGTADEFVRTVHLYIVRNVKYVSDGSWMVKSPERTLIDLAGDCSEMALLEVSLLTRHGIDARIIYGMVPSAGLHDAVEVHLNHYVFRTDATEQPVFVKLGDGLHPDEKIVD